MKKEYKRKEQERWVLLYEDCINCEYFVPEDYNLDMETGEADWYGWCRLKNEKVPAYSICEHFKKKIYDQKNN